ncbi:uncharacterized protein LOC114121953 [Aphis gossypii]|uniref:uncharacterized protein LOC114121953 n=1 Tax=Aphis gossypii TaxID=80765 RepID=UPI002158EA94|nr:uncharacterized protein LOC114121953 [Aphis gossypii]
MDTHAIFNENDEVIECRRCSITLLVAGITFGKGTLYVADSKLYWKNRNQVISMNYNAMRDFDVYNHPAIHKKPCMAIYLDLKYNTPDVDKVNQNEEEREEKKFLPIFLVPDRRRCLNEIYEIIIKVQSLKFRDIVDNEDEVKGSDRESNLTKSESDEHEDSDKSSLNTISSTCTLKDQAAGSIDVFNRYHELDAKNGEKKNQDEQVLINERKRKFEDFPEQEENPTKIHKLWNLMKYPFKKITSLNTSINENEPNISQDEVIAETIARKKNFLEPDTVCENKSDIVKAEEINSQNNSETDGENEDTSTNETSQQFCKIM